MYGIHSVGLSQVSLPVLTVFLTTKWLSMDNLLLINTRVLAAVQFNSGDELCTNLPNENTLNFVGF